VNSVVDKRHRRAGRCAQRRDQRRPEGQLRPHPRRDLPRWFVNQDHQRWHAPDRDPDARRRDGSLSSVVGEANLPFSFRSLNIGGGAYLARRRFDSEHHTIEPTVDPRAFLGGALGRPPMVVDRSLFMPLTHDDGGLIGFASTSPRDQTYEKCPNRGSKDLRELHAPWDHGAIVQEKIEVESRHAESGNVIGDASHELRNLSR